MHIPLIDLEGALQPGAPRGPAVAAALRAAARQAGFFYVRNHGVAAGLIERQFAIGKAFFDLPEQEKAAVALKYSGCGRGYESLGSQTLDAGARPDIKESFYCGIDYADDHPYVLKRYHTYGRNLWPAALPGMQAQCEAYIDRMCGLARRLMQLLALSLGLAEHHFDVAHASPMATLRLLRYPPHPRGADERSFGAGAHTDWGAVTLLAQDAHGGLEVCMPDGTWVDAPPIAGTYVVNLGDMIPRWTNDFYHSNAHRVRNVHSGGAPRYSIPFFYNPDYETRVIPLPSCIPAGTAARYAPCTVGEHLADMYRKTYGRQPAAV